MNIGIFTILYNDLPLEEALALLRDMGISTVELGCGGYSRSSHLDAARVVSDRAYHEHFRHVIEANSVRISGLGAQGNPVHPDPDEAARYHQDFVDTVLAAEVLGVDTVLLLSGCPGGAPGERTPNWVTCPWPEDFSRALAYQWDEVLVPYWQTAARFAAEHGVNRLAIEPHAGFCVYNTDTLLRLRKAVGPAIGVNFDPSHLFWQGIDPVTAIHALGDAIFHVHAKDCALHGDIVRRSGVLEPAPYSAFVNRAWNFRTVGFGHPEEIWRSIISALAEEGYDGAISIEHEDALMTREEGLNRAVELLRRVVIAEKPQTKWWELRREG